MQIRCYLEAQPIIYYANLQRCAYFASSPSDSSKKEQVDVQGTELLPLGILTEPSLQLRCFQAYLAFKKKRELKFPGCRNNNNMGQEPNTILAWTFRIHAILGILVHTTFLSAGTKQRENNT